MLVLKYYDFCSCDVILLKKRYVIVIYNLRAQHYVDTCQIPTLPGMGWCYSVRHWHYAVTCPQLYTAALHYNVTLHVCTNLNKHSEEINLLCSCIQWKVFFPLQICNQAPPKWETWLLLPPSLTPFWSRECQRSRHFVPKYR